MFIRFRASLPWVSTSQGKLVALTALGYTLSDLVRDLYLPKQLAELLGFHLQQWKVLDKDTRVTMYRNRNCDFLQYFTTTECGVCECSDVSGLMFKLGITHKAEE